MIPQVHFSFSFLFFGRIEDAIICFQDLLTFREVSYSEVSFFHHVSTQKIDQNFKIQLSYWSTLKFGSIFYVLIWWKKESSNGGTSLKSQIKIIKVLSPLCPADTSRQIWLMKLAASRKNGASFISDDSGGAPSKLHILESHLFQPFFYKDPISCLSGSDQHRVLDALKI